MTQGNRSEPGGAISGRITRLPRAFEPERGDDALSGVPWAGGDVVGLIHGAAGCSPYLAELIRKEGEWLEAALDDPEAARSVVLAKVASLPPDELATGLRRAKRRIALLAALADLAGAWRLEDVTGALTDLGDAACHRTATTLIAAQARRGKLPGKSEAEAMEAGAGFVALAMGKMGAHELNYSSDIDLICLFDDSQYAPEDLAEVRAVLVKVTRRLTAIFSDQTGDGYVFRTDLRLRPDASVTPVCLSMAAAESYYEGVGRTWERAAYIKARAAAGDIAAGERFLAGLAPFVWRKHLDFAAIQDAHDMRLRIRDHKGLHGPLRLPRHNVKLGRGGIREIEFFTQTRQLIAGGRDPSLRVRGTVEGLARLAAADWIPPEAAEALTGHYRAHRELEHRLQMIADAQTHDLPGSDEGFERLAAFMGTDRAALEADLAARFDAVHDLIEGFFAPDQSGPAPADPTFGEDVTARWPDYPALRSSRAEEIFRRLKPEILAALKEAAKPDEALRTFDAFLSGLPAGVQLFSLFEANPRLTRLVVDIAATAPALATYLSRNSAVFDAVIGGDFFADWPGGAALARLLSEALDTVTDYEAQLDAARRWSKEWHFRIGVHHLQGLITADEAGRHYADLAEACVNALWPRVLERFAAKHGAPPGRGAAVLAMGSLGARRLNAASDLDLIVIYDGQGADASDGRRPLATRAYYARLTQSLVTALTAPTAEGRLYEVDMRLRPSGRQGPVATSRDAFQTYQRAEAWTWEHLALTRARAIAGDPGLAAEAEAFRVALLAEAGQRPGVLADVADMRRRIAGAKAPEGAWDAKIGPGRLQDAELAAQTLALLSGSAAIAGADQVAAGRAARRIDAAHADAICRSLALFWQLQASARLLTGGTLVPEALGEGGRRMVLRETGQSDMDTLAAEMDRVARAADSAIRALLAGEAT